MRQPADPEPAGAAAPARLALVGLAVAAGVAGVWLGLRSPEPVPVAIQAASSPGRTIDQPGDAATRALVHVSGAVVNPGLVTIHEGDRVADAIAAAGGVLASADLSAINLAGPITDGQQIVVPVVGGRSQGGTGGGSDDGLVHLNTATATEIERLPGVGEVLAGRIVAYREANGPFQTLEDLLDIPGIGERKLEGFREAAAVP